MDNEIIIPARFAYAIFTLSHKGEWVKNDKGTMLSRRDAQAALVSTRNRYKDTDKKFELFFRDREASDSELWQVWHNPRQAEIDLLARTFEYANTEALEIKLDSVTERLALIQQHALDNNTNGAVKEVEQAAIHECEIHIAALNEVITEQKDRLQETINLFANGANYGRYDEY